MSGVNARGGRKYKVMLSPTLPGGVAVPTRNPPSETSRTKSRAMEK